MFVSSRGSELLKVSPGNRERTNRCVGRLFFSNPGPLERFVKLPIASALLISTLLCSGYTDALTSRENSSSKPTVILLHGLARTVSSMQRMELALQGAGYRVCNIAYPSREHPIAELAAKFIAPRISQCMADAAEPINFVTHSLGGIIVRELAHTGKVRFFGRVVMLGPPNHGSEVVDALGDWSLFNAVNGPAGGELGTTTDSVPQRLGPVAFETGVIAGSRSINWINSLIIPGADDGKVSVESAKLEGMRDFIVIAVAHPFLTNDGDVIKQTIRFLTDGCFAHDGQGESLTGAKSSKSPCLASSSHSTRHAAPH